jgi:hypothetical protein
MNGIPIILYYALGLFVLIGCALTPCIYGVFVGISMASRPRRAVSVHVALLAALALAVAPLDVFDRMGGNYSGSWPVPGVVGLLVQFDPSAYTTPGATAGYRTWAVTIGTLVLGLLVISWGITALVLKVRRRSAQRG